MDLVESYEEMAMAIQCEFEDELDETTTDQELLTLAGQIAKEILPKADDNAILSISEEVLKIYQPID